MIKKIFISISAMFCVISFTAYAQTEAGMPGSFSNKNLTTVIPAITTPAVNVATLLAEDEANVDKNVPYRFGFNHMINVDVLQQGVWETMSNGDKICRLRIVCPDALSVNLAFNDFNIPPGAKLYLYDESKTYIVGAYTSKNIQPDNYFGTDLVPGSEITVEYNEPAAAVFHGELKIYRITHGYRDVQDFAKSYGSSGSCQMNVNCPSGAGWENQKNSVVCIVVSGNEICTGAMIADVPHSQIPYFLTARHCTANSFASTDFSTWVFRFNWEAPGCTNQNSATNHTVNGATFKAMNAASDFCLLQLSSMPSAAYSPYLAGWNNQNTPSTSSTCIHHPSGDIKKISFDNGACTNTSWSGTPNNSHWMVDWDGGQCTEPGSSGSPLFDQNHRIIGQLHGGASACGSTDMTDEYGKFSMSWDYNSNNANQLKHWLDPNNTGNTTEDGYDPYAPTDTLNLALQNFVSTGASVCLGDTVIPQVVVKNAGYNPITSFIIEYNWDGGSLQNYNFNGSLAPLTQTTVTLPAFIPVSGTHQIWVHVQTVNGNIGDQEITDDTLQTSFTVISGNHLFIALTTDANGSQTTMDIKDDNQTIINSWGGFANNTSYNLNACLDTGCYTFTIHDAGGNGFSTGGSLHVTDEFNHAIFDVTTFTTQVVKQFCLGVPVTADFTFSNSPICSGKSITTINNSVNQINNHWYLTGPATQSGTGLTFSYSASASGTYTLMLVADNGGSYDTSIQTIVVYPTPSLTSTSNPTSSSTANNGSIDLTVSSGTSPFTYHWGTGATTEDISNLDQGTYCVTVTDANNCTKSTCVSITIVNGVSDLYFSTVKVFPNPANNFLTVDLGGIQLTHFNLYDELGRESTTEIIKNDSQILFNLSLIPSGVYYLKGENNSGTFTRKIVVVHE
ncbi:MAG TPA: hypothetical protein DCQ93_01755 [Bacteroidetes bacterium]|nr:hypothetical protein [Bacteroidota bacterium]